MNKSSSLFLLIKALSKQEKRYFKLFAKRHTARKMNVYIRLFNAVEKQKSYDESALRTVFAGESFIRHLRVHKQYLYEIILRSLDVFHANNSAESKLRKLIHYAEILYEKGLYKECGKVAARAKKLAIQRDRPIQMLEVKKIEKMLMQRQLGFRSGDQSVTDLHDSTSAVLSQLTTENDFWSLSFRMFLFYNRKGAIRTSPEERWFNTVMKHPLFRKNINTLSYRSKFHFYYSHWLYYFMKDDYRNAYLNNKKLISLMEARTGDIRENPASYIVTLNNFIEDLRRLKKYKECLHAISKLKAIRVTSKSMQERVFINVFVQETLLYTTTGEFEKGKALIQEANENLEKFKSTISKTAELNICYNAGVIYFGMGDYTKAKHWINRILNDTSAIHMAYDIYCFARLLNLVIHFELGDQIFLEYIVKSAYQFFDKKKRLYKFEELILNFMRRRLPKIISREEFREEFMELRSALLKITGQKFERKALEYFDFISWLDSKIENRPFAQILKRKAGIN